MNLKDYITELNKQFRTGITREHSYRPALQQMMSAILTDMVVTNEPARIDCGAPDYIISRKSDNIPVVFVEAKDIDDSDLEGRKQHKSQFNRYKESLERIIFTAYLDFHFYENRELKGRIRIANVIGEKFLNTECNIALQQRSSTSKTECKTNSSLSKNQRTTTWINDIKYLLVPLILI